MWIFNYTRVDSLYHLSCSRINYILHMFKKVQENILVSILKRNMEDMEGPNLNFQREKNPMLKEKTWKLSYEFFGHKYGGFFF